MYGAGGICNKFNSLYRKRLDETFQNEIKCYEWVKILCSCSWFVLLLCIRLEKLYYPGLKNSKNVALKNNFWSVFGFKKNQKRNFRSKKLSLKILTNIFNWNFA